MTSNKPASTGQCNLCGGTFNKAAITRHLELCWQKNAVPPAAAPKGNAATRKTYHLAIQGRYLPEYWLHLAMAADATLADLDAFLRRTWLECCGHLSSFSIEKRSYDSVVSGGFEDMGNESMKVILEKILRPKMKFYHAYDFGTTTDLTIKVVSEQPGGLKRRSLQILARNDPPALLCSECGKNATRVCGECVWSGGGWLCDKCAGQHECGEELLLPVVNSPRVGMCGYTGPLA